ncbi:MAG: hypothetical protein ACI8QF_002669 [Limisphaerales bacterium]|jgi:hypothetical protein
MRLLAFFEKQPRKTLNTRKEIQKAPIGIFQLAIARQVNWKCAKESWKFMANSVSDPKSL